MSVSPHDRASAIFTTVASTVCSAPELPRSAKFNSRRDNPLGRPFWCSASAWELLG